MPTVPLIGCQEDLANRRAETGAGRYATDPARLASKANPTGGIGKGNGLDPVQMFG